MPIQSQLWRLPNLKLSLFKKINPKVIKIQYEIIITWTLCTVTSSALKNPLGSLGDHFRCFLNRKTDSNYSNYFLAENELGLISILKYNFLPTKNCRQNFKKPSRSTDTRPQATFSKQNWNWVGHHYLHFLICHYCLYKCSLWISLSFHEHIKYLLDDFCKAKDCNEATQCVHYFYS